MNSISDCTFVALVTSEPKVSFRMATDSLPSRSSVQCAGSSSLPYKTAASVSWSDLSNESKVLAIAETTQPKYPA